MHDSKHGYPGSVHAISVTRSDTFFVDLREYLHSSAGNSLWIGPASLAEYRQPVHSPLAQLSMTPAPRSDSGRPSRCLRTKTMLKIRKAQRSIVIRPWASVESAASNVGDRTPGSTETS